MAGKQLGKFRQWAGEVISSGNSKTTVTDEYRDLVADIELRRNGVERLHVASEDYHAYISKKKDSEALDDKERVMPLDALGIVMLSHGEQFGHDSAFGTSLVKLGRAHCQIATLQEAFALTFQDTFLASVTQSCDAIKDYESQRKKLESRRLSYDAAITKMDKLKTGKKEKDKKEAEDELQKARLRYEETSEDVRARMHAIQESEIDQLHELTVLLDTELQHINSYREVLESVKEDWCDESSFAKPEGHARPKGPTHVFNRDESKFSSVRSKRSVVVEDDDGPEPGADLGRKPSHKRAHSSGKVPSRPSSRMSRKRSDSAVTEKDDKDKEKEKTSRMSMAGWASAVGSVTGRSKKNKEKFASLRDDERQEQTDSDEDGSEPSRPPPPPARKMSISRHKSGESVAASSPKVPPRILKAPSQERKLVRALYDFTGSSDELAFRSGDEILVVNEVIDGWWMGELDGRKGLFPTSYTEVVTSPSSSSRKPPLPERKPSAAAMESESEMEDYNSRPFADPHSQSSASPFFGASDVASITSNEDDERYLMPSISRRVGGDEESPSRPAITTRQSTTDIGGLSTTPSKKAPPPPPPRRSNTSSGAAPTVPDRRPNSYRSHSSLSAGSKAGSSIASSQAEDGGTYDSPFESATDLVAQHYDNGGRCRDFKQNPFKAKGMCSTCFEVHQI